MTLSDTVYFAYGSNLDGEQMLRRCPSARPRTVARLADHRLDFTCFSRRWSGGAADIVPDPGKTVWGLLYDLDSSDLALLDRYEGNYARTWLSVKVDSGDIERVVTYQVIHKRSFRPTSEYLNKMLRWGTTLVAAASLPRRIAPHSDARSVAHRPPGSRAQRRAAPPQVSPAPNPTARIVSPGRKRPAR